MRRWVVGLLACAALVGAGCSSDRQTGTAGATTATPSESATATASARPPGELPVDYPPLGFLPDAAATGIPGIDSLIADLHEGAPEVRKHIKLTEFTCAEDSNIVCVGDEIEGSRVEAFVIGECAGGGALRSVPDAAAALESVLSQPGHLRGVTSFSQGWTILEGYEVLWGTQLDSWWNLTLIVDEAGSVLGADAGCGFDPVGRWILPPPRLTATQERSREIETAWIKLTTLAEQVTSETCTLSCTAGTRETFGRYGAGVTDTSFEQRPGYNKGRHERWTQALREFCDFIRSLDDSGDPATYKEGVGRALTALTAKAGSRPVEFAPLPAFLP